MKASENSVKAARLFGLLGMISLLSYAAADIFAPLAYSGYDSLSQAVSDLSADTAPSTFQKYATCLKRQSRRKRSVWFMC